MMNGTCTAGPRTIKRATLPSAAKNTQPATAYLLAQLRNWEKPYNLTDPTGLRTIEGAYSADRNDDRRISAGVKEHERREAFEGIAGAANTTGKVATGTGAGLAGALKSSEVLAKGWTATGALLADKAATLDASALVLGPEAADLAAKYQGLAKSAYVAAGKVKYGTELAGKVADVAGLVIGAGEIAADLAAGDTKAATQAAYETVGSTIGARVGSFVVTALFPEAGPLSFAAGNLVGGYIGQGLGDIIYGWTAK